MNGIQYVKYLLVAFFLYAAIGFSQPGLTAFTVADGLSQGMVMATVQDREGFLWFGTRAGLNRFDGYTFQQYVHDTRDSTSLADNIIADLLVDSKGRLWVLTEGKGLDCFDRRTGIFHHLGMAFNTLALPQVQVRTLQEAPDGTIWVGCRTSIASLRVPDDFPQHPERIRQIRYQMVACGGDFTCGGGSVDLMKMNLLVPNQPVLVSATGEAWSWNPQTAFWTKHPLSGKAIGAMPPGGMIEDYRLCERPDGLILRLCNGRFQGWRGDQQQFDMPYPKKAPHQEKSFLLPTADGDVWMITDRQLFRISAESLARNAPELELVIGEQICYHLYEDRNHRLWVGTVGYGLRTLQTGKPAFRTALPGHSLGKISLYNNDTLLCTDRDAAMLLVLNGASESPIQAVSAISETGRVHTRTGIGYYRLHRQTGHTEMLRVERPGQPPLLLNLPVCTIREPIFEDARQRVWMASSNGYLSCHWHAADSFLHYFSYRHLWKKVNPEITTNAALVDPDGTIWLGTSQGLVQAQPTAQGQVGFRLWADAPGSVTDFGSNDLLSLLADPTYPDRYLWVGTNGSGFCRMDKQTGKCVRYDKSDGLPDNVVNGILTDDYGNLWLSTNFGISRFTLRHTHFHNFTTADGLPDNEFNTTSYARALDGTLIFGGINGLVIFHPKDLQSDTTFTEVIFTRLVVNNTPVVPGDSSGILQQPIEYTNRLQLPYNQNFITLSFAAPGFRNIGKATYHYRMVGVDDDWVFAGEKTEVSYPNLPPGTYTLRVASLNEAGQRNPREAMLEIVILPPWWRSTLAWMLYLLLAGAAIFLGVRFQFRKIRLQNELIYKEKEAQQLQHLDELKSRFFTNITHEFRTPLTLILEPARQLLQTHEDSFQNPKLRMVANNSIRLLNLVNQLLDIAKLEDEKMQLHPVFGDVLPVIREIFDFFLPLAARKQQQLHWECMESTLFVAADRSMLEKVVYNLLSNAHKFTPEGGEIRLEVARSGTNFWKIAVTDTGLGIPEAALGHIFDRFYQADGSHTRKGEGTGIGLALVKELVDLAGGEVSVQSEEGKGSRFEVTLPVGAEARGDVADTSPGTMLLPSLTTAEAAPPVAGLGDGEERTTILLVEDNDEMRHYVRMTLESAGYAVLEAENGAIGIEMAREHIPDLVISDVMMPEKDGFELTATLKQDALTSHIPIVLLTAKGRLESKIAGYEAGADAYLPKPFYTEELLVRLRQLLEVRRVLQQKYAMPGKTAPPDAPVAQNEATLPPQDAALVARVHAYIREHLREEDFSIEGLAGELAMSRSQLYRKVTALTGLSPARLIREHRLEAAHGLLISRPELMVAEVGLMVGIQSEHHFRTLFRERYGCTPQEARTRREMP